MVSMQLIHDWAESYAHGLKFIKQTDESIIFNKNSLYLLESGKGSRMGCLSNIRIFTKGTTINMFFMENDLERFKLWSIITTKLNIMIQHNSPTDCYLTEDLLLPLVSDNEEIIQWYATNRSMYDTQAGDTGDLNNPKDYLFYRYQSWLALNGHWDELGERCERILAMQDKIKRDRSYLIDHRFYLALAKGQVSEMEAVLLEKCNRRNRALRFYQESGYTAHFIVSYATLFAKLAWRHGYEVDVDTPWIPKAWLPKQPLEKYEMPWPFLAEFDIWQPFEGQYAALSPKKPSWLT